MSDINNKQIKILRTCASKVFADNDQYHEWLASNFGKSSTKKLNNSEAVEAIYLVSQMVPGAPKVKKSKGRYTGAGTFGMLTASQAWKIEQLEDALGWSESPQRLKGFIKRQLSKGKHVESLTNREASRVISGLVKLNHEDLLNDQYQ